MQIGLLAEISDHRKVVEQVAEQDEKLTQHWQSQVDKFGEIANAMRKTWHLLKSQTATLGLAPLWSPTCNCLTSYGLLSAKVKTSSIAHCAVHLEFPRLDQDRFEGSSA